MKVFLTALTVLFLGSGCRPNGPETPSSLQSVDAAPVGCFDSPQAGKILSVQPPPCLLAKRIPLQGKTYTVDLKDLRSKLETLVRENQAKVGGRLCVEGCAFTFMAAYYVPKLKSHLERSGKTYESAKACFTSENGLVGCSSAPIDWTDKGWSFFLRDFLNEMALQKVDILDDEAVSNQKVMAYLSE